jgi:hypothetical protein
MTYPRHDINPDKKGEDWIRQYAKAVWNDSISSTPNTIFYRNAEEYDRIAKYRTGTQDISQYKKFLTGDDKADSSWMKIDWSIRPIVSTKRDIVISKIHSRQTNITCTPIDILARDKADEYYNTVRTKILMREALQQANPELAQSPVLQPEPGEPEDLDELEMYMEYGYKHNAAMEAEMAIELVQYQNDWEQSRRQVIESLFDYGVGGWKDGIDADGRATIRPVKVENLITNYCRTPNFKDLTHVAEVLEVSVADLADKFSEADLKLISDKAINKNGLRTNYPGGSLYNRDTDRFKVKVMDLEFYSYNTIVYRQRINEEGNLVYRKSKYENANEPDMVDIEGNVTSKFIKRTVKVVYKCKWIVDTDFMYDFGLATNMKRDKQAKLDTSLSYHLFAYNFHEMKAQGYMERIIPIVDEYQNTIYKVQNFKQRWLPYIIDIDLNALESVALGKGGQKMKPLEVLDMMFQTNVLVGRKSDVAGNPNYKSVDIRPTGMAEEFSVLVNDLSRILSDLNIVLGLNELTDSTTPNSKTLVPVAQMAYESTNNALYPVIYADKQLSVSAAKGIIQRVQIAVKQGKVEGYVHALGTNSMKFISVSPEIAMHDFGIKITDAPTDDQRRMLLEGMNLKDSQGMIDPADRILVMNCNNLKQAEMILAYRIKKRQEKAQADAMAQQQQNGEIQMQSAQAAEQSKQQTMQLEYQLKMQLENLKGEWALKVAMVKAESTDNATQGKLAGTALQVGAAAAQEKPEE